MRKPFHYALFAILAIAIPQSIARAEVAALPADQAAAAFFAKPGTTKAPSQTATTAGAIDTPIVETLATKKAHAEANLRAIQTQFALFVTRTQATIDRLEAKKIDTTKARAELALSTTSLAEAKANLDLFAALPLPDETETTLQKSSTPKEIDTTEIKASLKKIEENLKDARLHLIESLTVLKASVAASIETQ